MTRLILRAYKASLLFLSLPLILGEFFRRSTGHSYRIGFLKKLGLVITMMQNTRRIVTGSSFVEHLVMATQILKLPPDVAGSVVECGSYKGGSAANLSLVCALSGRRLEVFDSFAGLPEPKEVDRSHALVVTHEVHTYSKGAWRGSVTEVKESIRKCGDLSVCTFHVGYFDETLPDFREPCVCAFVDVDLRSSLEVCVTRLWPLLQDGCYLFTHEAPHMEIASLFFDKNWWRAELSSEAPGLVGAGSGLGLFPGAGMFGSSLGYAVKNPMVGTFRVVPQTGR